MALTKFEKQTIILNQFERTIRNANRSNMPTVIEREIARSARASAEFAKKNANKPVAPRISFYVPKTSK